MRTLVSLYRLSFLLPPGAPLARTLARSDPPFDLEAFTVHSAGLVSITGASREAAFAQAALFLRELCRGLKPQSIAATMITTAHPGMPGGRDSWSIIVGADVAFSPTAMPPHFPLLERGPAERPPPQLQRSAS